MTQSPTCTSSDASAQAATSGHFRPMRRRPSDASTKHPAAAAAIQAQLHLMEPGAAIDPRLPKARGIGSLLLRELSSLARELNQAREVHRQATPAHPTKANEPTEPPPHRNTRAIEHHGGSRRRALKQATSPGINAQPVVLGTRVYTTKEAAKLLNADESTLRRKAATAWQEGNDQPQQLPGEQGWYVTGKGNAQGGRNCGWQLQQSTKSELPPKTGHPPLKNQTQAAPAAPSPAGKIGFEWPPHAVCRRDSPHNTDYQANR
jgi:hypothetical protein